MSIALLGLNILTGYNGQISLGHGAFYAIGAYTTAILLEQTTVPYWATIPIAGVICLIVGFYSACRHCGSKDIISRSRPSRSPLHAAIAEVPRSRMDRWCAGNVRSYIQGAVRVSPSRGINGSTCWA